MESDGPEVTVFPYGEAKKFRKGFEKEGRKFWWDPPASTGQLPFLPPDFDPGTHMLVFEGETDTMAAWQAAPEEARKSIVGISGTNAFGPRGIPREQIDALFASAKVVFFVFDNEDPYKSAEAVDSVERGWQQIKDVLGRRARRVRLPQGPQDVAEFFMTYDWAAFKVLLEAAKAPIRHYPRLDLSKPVPNTDWLVEDLLVSGEVTVLSAESGVGKSWAIMQLGLAVAGEEDTFLGLALKKHGNVIVVDEEQPQAMVHQRLAALGMTPEHLKRLHYLSYAGVDLANEPEKLMEEALDIEPSLIVLDSLSRVALGVEENSNTDMSKLFRSAIVPLARDSGAAVVAVHHTPTDNNGRPRGASAIRAAADQVISMVAATSKNGTKTGTINIFPSKPRRQLTHLSVRIEGDMEKDGWVRVKETTEDTPF